MKLKVFSSTVFNFVSDLDQISIVFIKQLKVNHKNVKMFSYVICF